MGGDEEKRYAHTPKPTPTIEHPWMFLGNMLPMMRSWKMSQAGLAFTGGKAHRLPGSGDRARISSLHLRKGQENDGAKAQN